MSIIWFLCGFRRFCGIFQRVFHHTPGAFEQQSDVKQKQNGPGQSVLMLHLFLSYSHFIDYTMDLVSSIFTQNSMYT